MTNSPHARDFIPINIAVLTVSDTRILEDDRSGDVLASRLRDIGHHLAERKIVKDEIEAITSQVLDWSHREDIDAILTTGGTGLTGRDVTPEAVEPLFDKKIDGFSALFHQISFAKIGTSTVQSRAVAGIVNATYVFCLPGSPGACKDAWDGISKYQLDYRHMPCNFIEIMPRLDEHLRRK